MNVLYWIIWAERYWAKERKCRLTNKRLFCHYWRGRGFSPAILLDKSAETRLKCCLRTCIYECGISPCSSALDILLLPYTEWLQPTYNKSCLGFRVFSFLSMFMKPVMAGTSPGLKRESYSYKSRSSFWKQLVAPGVMGSFQPVLWHSYRVFSDGTNLHCP